MVWALWACVTLRRLESLGSLEPFGLLQPRWSFESSVEPLRAVNGPCGTMCGVIFIGHLTLLVKPPLAHARAARNEATAQLSAVQLEDSPPAPLVL